MHVLCKIAFSLDWFQFGWECHHVVLWWKPSETTSINSLSSLSCSRHTTPNKTTFSLAPSTLPQCYPQKLCTLKTLPLSSNHAVGGGNTYPHLHAVKMLLWKAATLPLCGFRYFLTRSPCPVLHEQWFCIKDAGTYAMNPVFRKLSVRGLEQIQDHVLCHKVHQSVPLGLKGNASFHSAISAQLMCPHLHLYNMISFLMVTGKVSMPFPLGPLFYSLASLAPQLPDNLSLKILSAITQSQLPVASLLA